MGSNENDENKNKNAKMKRNGLILMIVGFSMYVVGKIMEMFIKH